MKLRYLISFLCITSGAFAANTSRTLTYEHDGAIYVAKANGKDVHKVAKGNYPDISPDGRWVAFTTDEGKDGSPVRHIAIVEAAGGKVRTLKSIPSNNSFGPRWSPDGSRLLFSTYVGSDWSVALVNADDSGYRVVKKPVSQDHFFSAPTWDSDGISFFCHDLSSIYRVALTGKELEHWKIEKLTHGADMDSGAGMAASSDGKSLLFEADLPDQHDRKDWEGPQPSIWVMDIASGKAQRISGKTVFATSPCWSGADNFLCTVHLEKGRSVIYQGSLNGKTWEVLVKNGENPGVSVK